MKKTDAGFVVEVVQATASSWMRASFIVWLGVWIPAAEPGAQT